MFKNTLQILFFSKPMITATFYEQDYYSAEELAAELGVSSRTISRWRKKGRIPADGVVRHGLHKWYRRDVIDPLINAGMLDRVNQEESFEPAPESLILYENLELLPEHYERYIVFHRRYAAGILESSTQFGLKTFGPSGTPLKLPPPSIQTHQQPIQPTTEENTMTIETYSEADIAEILEVPGQRVRAWKRRGIIPAGAVTDDGRYKKTAIDRLIESGTLVAPEPDAEPAKPARRKAAASKPPESSVLPSVTREEFLHGFWSQKSRAVNVLTLSPEISATIVRIVNEALQYGHEWFERAVIENNDSAPEWETDENFQ